MKKGILSITLLAAGLFLFSMPAQAIELLNEDFTGVTIADSLTIDLTDNPGNTTNDNLNTWIDFPDSDRWGIVNWDVSGDIARHLVQTTGDSTNLLFYAFENPCTDGGMLSLDFGYTLTDGRGSVVVAGLNYGVNALDPYAAWFDDENPLDPGYVPDGVVLIQETLSLTAGGPGQPLTPFHSEQYVGNLGDYDVLAIGFIMGGTTGYRMVDNIELNCAPVPEPSTLLLLGGGLAGLAGVTWRRRKNG